MKKDAKGTILKTAVNLFSRYGFSETSIREISKKAGVNTAMISYYFGGKEGILQEISGNITEQFGLFIEDIDLNDIDSTIRHFRELLDYLEERRLQVKIILSELEKGADYLTPIRDKIIELQKQLGRMILSQGTEKSELYLNKKLQVFTDVLFGMIFSDYVLDFSSFLNINGGDRESWRNERIEMIVNILEQVSGIKKGKINFESIL